MNTAVYAMSAPELAGIFGLTSRRITQYRDDKLLPIIERGRFDVAWLVYLRMGERRSEHMRKRPGRDTLVALGWLGGMNDRPSDDDINHLASLFERNGLTRDAALIAIGQAKGLLAK